MMSRSNTLPSLSSSRQMTMAWKVSGLSQRPAIMASRPASMRLAMAILALARKQFHRAHFAQIHADGVVDAPGEFFRRGFGRRRGLLDLAQLAALALGLLARTLIFRLSLLGLDHVDTHLAELRQDVLDLFGLDLFRGQQLIDLDVSDIAALVGAADQLLDGGVREIEQRAVGPDLGTLLLQHLFLQR